MNNLELKEYKIKKCKGTFISVKLCDNESHQFIDIREYDSDGDEYRQSGRGCTFSTNLLEQKILALQRIETELKWVKN